MLCAHRTDPKQRNKWPWELRQRSKNGSTSAQTFGRLCPDGRLRLFCPVAWIRAPPAPTLFPALASTACFRSAAHVARMTRPHFFHTAAAPVSSMLFGRLVLPLPQQHHGASASSRHRRWRPAPPTCVGGRGLALPALMDTNASGLHLQHETLEYNIHLKEMKH
jgi:hypothetical protein